MLLNLQSLLKIGHLKAHPHEATESLRPMAAVARNLIDAVSTSISPETRYPTLRGFINASSSLSLALAKSISFKYSRR